MPRTCGAWIGVGIPPWHRCASKFALTRPRPRIHFAWMSALAAEVICEDDELGVGGERGDVIARELDAQVGQDLDAHVRAADSTRLRTSWCTLRAVVLRRIWESKLCAERFLPFLGGFLEHRLHDRPLLLACQSRQVSVDWR